MELREWLITTWPFAQSGTTLDFVEMSARRSEFLARLMADLPCLQQLRSSVVIDALQSTTNGMVWRAVLKEIPQLGLRLHGSGSLGADAFDQEVEQLRKAQEQLGMEYRLALSPARDPANDERTAGLRRRAKKHGRDRRLQIAGRDDQCELLLPAHMPDQMPLAELCSLHVTVLQLTRTRALVKLARGAHLSGAGASIILAGTELQLLRGNGFSDVGAGHRLQVAMDTRRVLHLQTAVVRRWDDGTVNQLELNDFLEANS